MSNEEKWREMGRKGKKRKKKRRKEEGVGGEKELELLLIILIEKKYYIHVSPTILQSLLAKGVLQKRQ